MEVGEAEEAADFLTYRQGALCVQGTPLQALAERFGTPFFLISEARLRANYRTLARGLAASGPGSVVRYCAKTNHEAAVLATLAGCGSHLLASHAGEVKLALRCGFPAERIAYARPVLTREELGAVIGEGGDGVGLVHVHRPEDLDLLETAAAGARRRVRGSLRLRREGFSLSPLERLNRRLGFGADELVAACRRLAGSRWLEPAAVNFYLGTQQPSLDGFARELRAVLGLLERVAATVGVGGVALGEVNLGGGIPSPALWRVGPGRLLARLRDRPAPSRPAVDLAALARRFGELADGARLPARPTLAAEPGRAIVGDAAILVTRVRALSGRWAFLDASRNFLPESPLLFSRRILPLREPAERNGERFYHLSGSTLNTLDVLDLRRRLPRLEVGDLLAFCDAGAYSISRASSYAGLPPAVWALGEDGAVRLARAAGSVEDLLRPMILQAETAGAGR
jgi:diaminopimelate decarboxylase